MKSQFKNRTNNPVKITVTAFTIGLLSQTALVPIAQASLILPNPAVSNHQPQLPLVRVQANIDLRPAGELSDDELVQRIEQLKVLPASEAEAAGIDIKSMIKADRQERKARQSATVEAPASEEQPQASEQATEQATEPTSQQATEQATEQASEPTSEQTTEQAVEEAPKEAVSYTHLRAHET